MTDAPAILARLREREAEERSQNRLPYADELRDEIELIESLQAQLSAQQSAEPVALRVADIVLDVFERCASKMVTAEYANGYRQAIEHIRKAATPQSLPEVKEE